MRETLSTQLRIFVYVWTHIMSFCTLTLMFLYSLGGRPLLYSTKQNLLVYQSLPVLSKEIKLFTALILL